MPENGAHFSGQGHLIEGEIEGHPNKEIRPIVCDAEGHLIIDLDASTLTIGTVEITDSNGDPIIATGGSLNVNVTNTPTVAISQTGTNNDVEVVNGPGAAAVNIQDGGNSITVDGPLTDAQLRASPVPVLATFTPSGTQNVNIVSTIPVPVTDNGGSLTIDGTVAISQTGTDNNVDANITNGIGAAAVNIQDGGNSITVDGTVAISNFPVTQPVSGTVTANQGTSPWVVSGTVTSNIGTTGGLALDATLTNGTQITQVSNFPASVEVSNDAGNPLPVSGTVAVTQSTSPWVVSGTVVATPTGTQDVNIVGTTVTQPISAVSLPLPTGAATAALQTQPGVDIGDVTVNNAAGVAAVNIQDGGNSITVDGVFFQATQPISGTVTANVGTTGGLALDATLTNGTQVTQVSNFPASVEVSNDVGNPLPVSGTVTANQGTSPWIIDGTVTNTPPANQSINLEQLNAVDLGSPSAYGTSPGAVSVIGVNAYITNTPAVTLASTTITGTVTVVQPTGTNLHVVTDDVSTTATLTNVAASTTSVMLLAANANRKMASIYNDGTRTLSVKMGTTASATSFTTKVFNQSYFELPLPIYTGRIDGIWDTANGSARITEYT